MDTLQQAVNIWYSSSNTGNIIAVLSILLAVIFVFFLIPYALEEIKQANKLKENFHKDAEEYGLSSLEEQLVWKYSKDYRWNMSLVFNNKKVFEIIASRILKDNPNYVDIVSSLRHRLGFEKIPWFLPVSSTKDIELYQMGKIIFNEREYEAVVWDKDEINIYLALYYLKTAPIKVGDEIEFSFTTSDYAKAYFKSKVVAISEDGDRSVYKVEHVDKVIRTPLREAVRLELNLKAYLYIPYTEELEAYKEEKVLPELDESSLIEGTIKDLSIGGARFCTNLSLPVDLEHSIFLKFNLYAQELIVYGVIKSKIENIGRYCYGIKFDELSKEQEESIRSYVIEQQRLEIRAYKLGES